ncbi:hypothetical protein F8568_032195 [Actinomadura sp. LD22]|uniref:Type I restriction modification DNA specificity domain-containing protein n=1 Tax=Actinomadura physcomitrii TaxID=2650748 RepID=A0A6I4MRM4_9ACTN|nr:restriction endonuclease subunit S [Actinomadura physcomitrii]MWA04946.1 hypothetical protein [Actinomadura physcomitrii]
MSDVFGAELPAGWSATRLKSVVTYLRRGTAPDYVEKGEVRAISQAANQDDGLDWSRTRFHKSDGRPATLKGYLKAGDILVNSTGTGTLGRVGFFEGAPDDIPCMADGHVTIVRTDNAEANSRYAYYWLRSRLFQDYIYAVLAVGATNQIELNREGLANAPFPSPPIEEQRRIADFLDAETARIDRAGSLQKRILATLEERERAHLDIAIDELIETCGSVPLRRFVWSVDQGVSPQCDAAPADEGEWGVLKVSCLRPGVFLPHENKRLPKEVPPFRESEVRDGDLLITRANTPELVGSTAVVNRVRSKLLLSDKIFRVRLSPGMLPEFVATVARGSRIRALCASSANGASQSMANIRFEEVKAWPMPLADVRKQKRFVAEVVHDRNKIEEIKPRIKAQLALLAERRQALITAAVTGQFDVSTASGRGVTG